MKNIFERRSLFSVISLLMSANRETNPLVPHQSRCVSQKGRAERDETFCLLGTKQKLVHQSLRWWKDSDSGSRHSKVGKKAIW
jgi:hypothetical protein